MSQPRIVLGFDFGLKNIGVAIGQELTSSANQLTVITAREGIPHWNEIVTLIQQWNTQLLVVGLPLNMDGTEQKMTATARKFGNRLSAQSHLQVIWQDERLSTYEALEQLGISNKGQARRRR